MRHDCAEAPVAVSLTTGREPSYFSCEDTLLNVVFSDVPIEFTAATITMEIPAATRAYSMAVARHYQ